MAAFLLCGWGAAGLAQTPGQRLAEWSQAIMRRRAEDAHKAAAAETLRAQLRASERRRTSDLERAPEFVLRRTGSPRPAVADATSPPPTEQ